MIYFISFLFFVFFIYILSNYYKNDKKSLLERKYSFNPNEPSDDEPQEKNEEELTNNKIKRENSLDDDSKIVEVIKKRRRNMSPTRKRYPCIIERWEVEDALRKI